MKFSLLRRVLFVVAAFLLPMWGCATQPMPGYTQPNQVNLTSEVRRLQGALSSQERSLEELRRDLTVLTDQVGRQEEEIAVLEERLKKSSRRVASVLPTPASPAQPVVGSQTLPVDLEGSPTDIYLRAFGNYANGRYDAAILGFDAFLENFPNNSYASNAQFWLADCYLKQQRLPEAAEAFNRMLQIYPRAAKEPEALLKIATIALQLDNPDQARVSIESLRRNYPDSPAARKSETLVLP